MITWLLSSTKNRSVEAATLEIKESAPKATVLFNSLSLAAPPVILVLQPNSNALDVPNNEPFNVLPTLTTAVLLGYEHGFTNPPALAAIIVPLFTQFLTSRATQVP